MKIKFILLSAVLFVLINLTGFASSAHAQVMDNDPSSAYNGSAGVLYGSWGYHKYSGDYNGDDRTSSTTSSYRQYYWNFYDVSAGHYYVYAYLANPNFTDRAASYDLNGDFVCTFNQYSAPSGWNFLGDAYTGSGTSRLIVNGYNYTTGADAVRITKQ